MRTGLAAIAGLALSTLVVAQQAARPSGWDEATHGRVPPDHARVFAMDRVHDLRITIPPDRFRAMQDDLRAIAPGGLAPGRGIPPLPAGMPDPSVFMKIAQEGVAACKGQQPASACTAGGMAGQCTGVPAGPGGLICMPAEFAKMMRGGLAPALVSRDPIYVPVTITYDGRTWTSVGMRYKGNSSLMSANVSGSGKVPFRLHFDRYEDEAPAIRNQRFHGFQELTFSSNLGDDSQLRETLAGEAFRDRGVPAPRTAFYRIHVDTGAGYEYWGLYTMVEDPSDGAMLETQFGSRDGNLYKPDGPGANWVLFDRAGFEKKTNRDRADFGDIEGAIAALHAPRDNPAAWRAALETRVDVDHFLRWLAVNTVIENWDAYGVFPHNYYLYGDPSAGGRLRWIPWDHNFSFGLAPRFGPPGAGRGMPPPGLPARGGGPMGVPFGGGDVLHRQVTSDWPLIRYLLDDEVYARRYRALLLASLEGLLEPAAFERRARQLHAMIASSVLGERPSHTTIASREAFEQALDGPGGLIARLRTRQDAVRAAVRASR